MGDSTTRCLARKAVPGFRRTCAYLAEMIGERTAELSPPLSAAEVRLLMLRTEGWIAGLQLAALAMQKREDRAAFLWAFTGSQRYLLDYVQEDILARLS